MIAVHQTEFSPGRGNCFSACLASLLEIPLAEVPNFRADFPPPNLHQAITDWLKNFGLMLLRIRMRDDDGKPLEHLIFFPLPDGAYCIASGKSPRGRHGHSVVAEIRESWNYRLIHDPHPEAAGIENLWTLDFLIALDPAKLPRNN